MSGRKNVHVRMLINKRSHEVSADVRERAEREREIEMLFNDKELGAWASVFSADKEGLLEGLLEKKGAGRGQGE